MFQVDRDPRACSTSPGLPLLSQTLPSSSLQAQRREKPSSRPCPPPSLQAFTEKKLKGPIKLLDRNSHRTEGETEAPRGNSTAPGHTVRFKPRTLSTTQNVLSYSAGLGVKYQVKALVLPASGKEDRAVHGPTLFFKGRGRAVCWWMLAPKDGRKVLPVESIPNPTLLGVRMAQRSPSLPHWRTTQAASGSQAGSPCQPCHWAQSPRL